MTIKIEAARLLRDWTRVNGDGAMASISAYEALVETEADPDVRRVLALALVRMRRERKGALDVYLVEASAYDKAALPIAGGVVACGHFVGSLSVIPANATPWFTAAYLVLAAVVWGVVRLKATRLEAYAKERLALLGKAD